MESVERFANDERLYTLVLDVRHGAVYSELHQRIYGRALFAINATQVIAGSAAITSLITHSTPLAAVAGAVLAVVGTVGALVDVGGRAEAYAAHARRYDELDLLAGTIPIDEFSRRLSVLQAETKPGELDGLSQPAYNINLTQNGRADAAVPLTRWERCLAALAR